MKKRTSKIFAVAMALVMMLSMTLVLTSCGGSEPQTLEEYVAENPEALEELEDAMTSNAQSGVDVKIEVKKNTITCSFQFDVTLDEDEAAQAEEIFEEYMDSASYVFEAIGDSFEEETEIDGIKCQVIYLNGDGSELYNRVFE